MRITKVDNVKKAAFGKGILHNNYSAIEIKATITNRVAKANSTTQQLHSIFKRKKKTPHIMSELNKILKQLRADNTSDTITDKLNRIDTKIKQTNTNEIGKDLKDEYKDYQSAIVDILKYKSRQIQKIDNEEKINELIEVIKNDIKETMSTRIKNIDSMSKSIENQIINYVTDKDVSYTTQQENKSTLAYQDIFNRIKNDNLPALFEIIKNITKDICNKTTTLKSDINPEILCFWKNKVREYISKENYQDEKHKDIRKDVDVQKRITGKINNLITSKLIEYGKMLYHFTDNEGKILSDIKEITSFDLEAIKAMETLTKKTNTALMYTTSIFANILLEDIDVDILYSYTNIKEDKKIREDAYIYLSKYFGGKSNFETHFHIKESDVQTVLDQTRDILYKLRNQNFHYCTQKCKDTHIITDAIKIIYNKDCEQQPKYILDKYKSNNVFNFYDKTILIEHIEKIYSKDISITPIFVPSFKNVFSKLSKEKEYNFYIERNILNTISKKDIDYKQTLHFVLKEIYYQAFLPENNYKKMFIDEAIGMLEKIQDEKTQKAFKDFKDKYNREKDKKSILDFFKNLHTEYNLQNTKSNVIGEKLEHYNLISRQLLAKAFWLYIGQNFKFILTPQYRDYDDDDNIRLDELINSYKNIINQPKENVDNDILLAFYIIGKFIPAKELNFLKGDFLKYKQFIDDIKSRVKIVKSNNIFISKISERYSNCDDIIKILSLCQVSNGIISNNFEDYYKNTDEFSGILFDFISNKENLKSFKDLQDWDTGRKYTNELKPIVFAQIEKSRMYFTYNIIKKIYKPDITISDIKSLKEIEGEDFYKNFHVLNDSNSFNNTEQWIKTVNAKNQYMQIKNKVEFANIQKLSDLIIDIYSFLISWCYTWERDLEYFLLGLSKIKGISQSEVRNIFIYDGNSIGKKLNPYIANSKNGIFIETQFFKNNRKNITTYRNRIDHFYYFNVNNKESLIALYNKIYNMLCYNKKLQNNVFPKLINILESHKIVCKKQVKQQYNNQNKSKTAIKEIKLKFLGEDFIKSIPQLLNYPEGTNNNYTISNKIFNFTYNDKNREIILDAELDSDKCTYICPIKNDKTDKQSNTNNQKFIEKDIQ